MDVLSTAHPSPVRTASAIARNPQILATIAGLAAALSGLGLPEGLLVFTRFAGATAAPCALFALGVVLSRQDAGGERALPLMAAALKLIVYPLLCWAVLTGLLQVNQDWAKPALMVAAAPGAAMAFVLALNYGVPAQAIARIVLLTMLGALVTVTLAAGL
jgi:hypothetical protein